MTQRQEERPFEGAQRVVVTGTFRVDVYVMPPSDETLSNSAFGGPYNHGSLVRSLEDDLEDTLKYKLGWCMDAEEGDATIAALEASASVVSVERMPDPDPAEVRRWAEGIESERPGG